MKKIIIFVLILILAGGAAVFYMFRIQPFLEGIKPILQAPPREISKIIEEKQAAEERGEYAPFPFALPEDFSISIFAKGLEKPRVMAWGPDGNLLVSIPSQGRIAALLPDKDGDGISDGTVIVADKLNQPHGMAFDCRETPCQFYIAETDKVSVYDYDETNTKTVNPRKIIDLPGGGNHFTRTIMFMPYPDEDKLLISVGSSCNVCYEKDWRRAKILVYDIKSKELETFASGLRNAVFMSIHPVSGEVWVTEMGRDWLGDDLPPDEINIVSKGGDYGWPTCYGKNIHDADFDKNKYLSDPCGGKTPSYIDIPAHLAPLGLAFFPEEGWPEEYWYNLLVSYHGSWNRSAPAGYKIARYKLDEQENYLGEEDFISGWLQDDGSALGRPVDILIQPGGIIYISDDKAGVIYKVLYHPPFITEK